jgi:hypothetical protein
MPQPSSAMRARTPAAGLPVAGAAGAQRDPAGAGDGVEGVGDQVGEDLAHVAGEAQDSVGVGELAADGDLAGGHAALEEADHGVEDLGCAALGGV